MFSELQPNDPPLQQYLDIVKRQIAIVILVPVLTIVAVNALLELKNPAYKATTTLVVGEPSGGERPPNLGTTSVTRTMTSLIESDYISRNVIRRLRMTTTRKDFAKNLKVEVLPDTSVLNVSYKSTNPKLALAVVSEISRLFERQLGESLGVLDPGAAASASGSFELIVRQFDPPNVGDAIVPNRTSTLILAGIAGLVLGLMLAVARDSLDFRIRGGKDAEEWFGAPVVGSLPKSGSTSALPGAPRSRFGVRRAGPHAQSLELLRARLQFSQMGVGGPTILVTSARPKEGKSSVSASLGVALARAEARVICVDADLQRPNLHKYLGIESDGPGLVEVLQGKVPLEEALVRVEAITPSLNGQGAPAVIDWDSGRPDARSRLEILPAGAAGPQSGLFNSAALIKLIAALHQRADYVVFDSPPLVVADSFALARHSDNVLIVARRGRTTREHAEWARATLQGLGVDNTSVVLTNAPRVEAYA
jgi:Mrp family chromosome partitioning ATPase/capsular polysaccharide biosynthesis protein